MSSINKEMHFKETVATTMKVLVVFLFIGVCAAFQVKPFFARPVPLKDAKTDGSRIISGEPAAPGQFPWQAAVYLRTPAGLFFCGGTLIHPEWVLTAAHCAKGVTSWTIKVGGVNVSGDEEGSVTLTSTEGYVHEDYNAWGNNDIALVHLPKKVPISDRIRPIKLPSRSEVNDPLENMKLTVSGWGRTSDTEGGVSPVLNFVELDTITNKQCADVYGNLSIVDSTLCCIGHPEHSTCNGDSGGPLIRLDQAEPVHVGVVSFGGAAGCASGMPSGYVRSAKYLDWFKEKTGMDV